ncbi:hypothetical protein ACFL0T_05465 [Candidatus Omnitrophota bacterium]
MAQEGSATPEKQLLKLIEDPSAHAAAAKGKIIKRKGKSLFSPGAWLGRISFFKGGLRGLSFRRLNMKAVNRILGLSNFVLIAYLGISISNSVVDMKNSGAIEFKIREGAKAESITLIPLLKQKSFYLSKVRQRNIFKMGAEDIMDTTEEPIVEATSTTAAIIEATQHLKLVGISWSSNPDAMIEDTRALRTFFVKSGQMIGEVKVVNILKDRIVLSHDGEEIELR